MGTSEKGPSLARTYAKCNFIEIDFTPIQA